MNIILIGYRCSGKTSVGRELAKVLGMEFIDTDEVVEQASHSTISEIVSQSGWPAFRNLEQEAIKRICQKDSLVIATGGGVVMRAINIERLKTNGFIVWLKASAETIKQRMAQNDPKASKRPPLHGKDAMEEIQHILGERERLYQRAADLIVDTSGVDIQRVVDTIVAHMESLNQKGKINVR